MAVSAFGVKCEEERRRGSAPAPPGNTPTSSGVCYSWPLSKISPNLKSICYFSSIWTQSKASIEHSSVESSRSTTRPHPRKPLLPRSLRARSSPSGNAPARRPTHRPRWHHSIARNRNASSQVSGSDTINVVFAQNGTSPKDCHHRNFPIDKTPPSAILPSPRPT